MKQNTIPSYRWICPVCDASNAPADTCNRCAAPVSLSASEMELARSHGVAALYSSRDEAERARANWMARPLWRRIGDVVLGTTFVVGLVLIRVTLFAGTLRSVAGVGVAVLLPTLWFVSNARSRR